MTWTLVVAGSFFVPFVSGLAIGRGRRRQLALAALGVVFWLGLAVWAKAECEGDVYECYLVFPYLASLAVVWVVGAGMAALVRRERRRPGWRTVAAMSVGLLIVGTGYFVGRYSYEIQRLGCRTDAQLPRAQGVEGVVGAFAEAGLPLEEIRLPAAIGPTGHGPPRGTAFRHVIPGATLYVVVCPEHCMAQRRRHDRMDTSGQRWRVSWDSGGNIPIWITETDREAGTRLLEEVREVVDEIYPRYEDRPRCWFR